MIQFGSMSITLLIGALFGLLIASLLWFSPANRRANRFLALLLVVIVLRMFPYIIGYAGFYDAYPWLSFFPYNWSLAIGPLIYAHVRELSGQPLRPREAWHFVPVFVQAIYYTVIFAQPVAFKNDWDDTWEVPLIGPILVELTFMSIGYYWWRSHQHYRRYQDWLATHHSQLEEHRMDWFRHFLLALALTLVFWLAMVLIDHWIMELDYFQRFPFYVWLGLLVYYLGTEGYRHARHQFPVFGAIDPAPLAARVPLPERPLPEPATRSEPDWPSRANAWRDRLVAAGWWRDPELTLASLARKLGTNTTDLSKAINDGLGMNFNELINRLRVEAVSHKLIDTPESGLLDLALECGFSSKASFNRCFKRYTGLTPSAYRDAAQRQAE
ncbi:AraC family transcriptional regulator [Ahniella affigens]|uniref:AraC family transcriptional regulator n=2 Tax=Ahniella affigens TaxID=2021234 RepID=A0A2P1PYK9_9GAMM|nr:AraC family transcriptional regulator [Ahniella affigens]